MTSTLPASFDPTFLHPLPPAANSPHLKLLAKELDHVAALSLAMHQHIQSQGLLHANCHAQVRRHGAAVFGGTTVAGAPGGAGGANSCMELKGEEGEMWQRAGR